MEISDYNLINLYLSGKIEVEDFFLSKEKKKGDKKSVADVSKSSFNPNIGYIADMSAPHLREIALLLASSLSTSPLNVFDMNGLKKESLREEADLILTQLYFGLGYSRLRQFFHSEGKNNTFGLNYPFVDYLIFELEKEADMRKRNAIGEEIISFLQEENAIILLAPCFEYFLSNLYLVPSPKISSLTSFILNLSNICVERTKVSSLPKS